MYSLAPHSRQHNDEYRREHAKFLNDAFVFSELFAIISGDLLQAVCKGWEQIHHGNTRERTEHHHEVHCMLFIVCNLIFYLSLSVSWLGLRPLLLSMELSSLADFFTWLLLFSLFAVAIRLGAWLHTLLGVRLLASLLVPVIPVVAANLYGLTFAPRSTIFWPAANPVLLLAVLVFAVGAVGGGVETAIITFYGQHEFHQRLLRFGNILIVSYLSAAITAVALLWFSIASA